MVSSALPPNPTFSVIMPVYNSESTLDSAVESVLRQTYGDFELLIVDDGSTDGSCALAEEYSARDERVTLIRMPGHSGGPRLPRNRAIGQARGSYLAFLDQDDLWLPSILARHRAKRDAGSYAVTYSRCRLRCPDNPEMHGADYHSWWRLVPHEGVFLDELVRSNFVPLLTASVARSWVQHIGGLKGAEGADDWNLWLRVAAHGGRFGFIDESLAVYNWSSGNLSHALEQSAYARRLRTLRDLAQEFPSKQDVFAKEERRVRYRATQQRLRRLPRPVRHLLGKLLLPPRLWMP